VGETEPGGAAEDLGDVEGGVRVAGAGLALDVGHVELDAGERVRLVGRLAEEGGLALAEEEAARRPADARGVRGVQAQLLHERLRGGVPVGRRPVVDLRFGHAREDDAGVAARRLAVVEIAIAPEVLELDATEVDAEIAANAPVQEVLRALRTAVDDAARVGDLIGQQAGGQRVGEVAAAVAGPLLREVVVGENERDAIDR
jgi:hypothetical protein